MEPIPSDTHTPQFRRTHPAQPVHNRRELAPSSSCRFMRRLLSPGVVARSLPGGYLRPRPPTSAIRDERPTGTPPQWSQEGAEFALEFGLVAYAG
eukprot:8929219-Pyramimonas_sp.AAC.2